MLKILHTRSLDMKPEGAISARHVHTPITQYMLISAEDFLLIILAIRGIFQNGSIIAATNAMASFMERFYSYINIISIEYLFT